MLAAILLQTQVEQVVLVSRFALATLLVQAVVVQQAHHQPALGGPVQLALAAATVVTAVAVVGLVSLLVQPVRVVRVAIQVGVAVAVAHLLRAARQSLVPVAMVAKVKSS